VACDVPGRGRVWTDDADDCRRLVRRAEDERKQERKPQKYACDVPGRGRVMTDDAGDCRRLIDRMRQDQRRTNPRTE
jgi:hypothetical protein